MTTENNKILIRCKATFREFGDPEINRFIRSCEVLIPKTFKDIKFGNNIQMDTATDDPKKEYEFSYNVNNSDIRDERHQNIVDSLKELTRLFDTLRDELIYRDEVKNNASVSVSIFSNDIFPKKFQLRSICSVDGLYLGNIMNRSKFLPTTLIKPPPDDVTNLMSNFMFYSKDEQNVECSMVGLFEHDREFMNILFPDVYVKYTSDNFPKRVERIVELQAKYNSIRRCIISFGSDNENEDGFFVNVMFQLSSPLIVYVYQTNDRDDNNEGRFRNFGNRFLTWNSKADYKHLIAHASWIKIECLFIHGREFLDFIGRLQKKLTNIIEFRTFKTEQIMPLLKYKKLDLDEYPQFSSPDHFKLAYAIEALISRGGIMYDYFFHPTFGQFEEFVLMVEKRYFDDELKVKNSNIEMPRTLAVLEEMLLRIDRNLDLPPPLTLFEQIYNDETLKLTSNLSQELLNEGYMRVRRIIITPTRKIYVNPELVMGNRSLRKMDADSMLRISFRDDINRKMSNLPQAIIKDTIEKFLTKPLIVGCQRYTYLGSSNSQLRDHGCYFIRGTDEDAIKFRDSCGKFEKQSVSKMMSRIGQVFTQSRQVSVELSYYEYSDLYDYTGGRDSSDKPHIFSDGVGRISKEFCQKIVKDLKLGNCLPTCYQIRFRGYKGILCLYQEIDNTRNWVVRERIDQNNEENIKKLPWYNQSVMFRMSQKKFEAPIDKHMEIVKISSPINVNLNKPLINIMDQVSEKQGLKIHKRMENRIFELLEIHIRRNINALVDEVTGRIVLNEFTKLIHYELLEHVNVTEEPFFRTLLRATAAVQLKKLKDKMQIRVPRDLGRMMFGVVDETGLLQYGQVFFQYTVNADLKYPHESSEKIIHTGPVMVTKNPSIVPGDYRRFEAVDLPALHDLVDVIVFPQHGPVPHPQQMAGSDLDGDEYSVIWDPSLFLEYNEDAFDFTASTSGVEIVDANDKDLTKKMANFFVKYITQDSIGTIATSHLANSDLYGIYSEVCESIAKKHNQAVDFPKNGQIPDELTRKWGSKGQPPERVERFPQFMPRYDASTYKSKRLLGKLHDRITELAEMVGFESLISQNEIINVDQSYLVDDYEKYIEDAYNEYNEFRYLLENLMNTYGIKGEGELFSGHYSSLTLRLSDKDNDDMSLFNTSHMIEEQLVNIYGKFRSRFFDNFGGIESCSEIDDKLDFYGIDEIFRRVVVEPTTEMYKKASAYYYVAYQQQKCLSFGWLVSDIMVKIRRDYIFKTKTISYYPLADNLNNKILNLCDEHPEANEYFNDICNAVELRKSTEKIELNVAASCGPHPGFAELLFYIRKWADMNDLNDEKLPKKELDIFFWMYGYGYIGDDRGVFLHPRTLDSIDDETDLALQYGGLGKIFLDFIQYLMTSSFMNQDELSLKPYLEVIWKKDLIVDISTAAYQTFYPIALNRRYDVLPGLNDDNNIRSKDIEGNHILIEIPKHTENDYEEMLKIVALKCGCKQIARRRKPERFNSTVYVISAQPVGSFQAIQKLRKLLSVEPSDNMSNLKARVNDISEQVLKKLQYYSQEFTNINDSWPPTDEFYFKELKTFKEDLEPQCVKRIVNKKSNSVQQPSTNNPFQQATFDAFKQDHEYTAGPAW